MELSSWPLDGYLDSGAAGQGNSLIEEMLRIASPTQLIGRAALSPTRVDRYAFDEGDRIDIHLGAVNRDPSRFSGNKAGSSYGQQHLAFGAGMHFCLGADLARREARILTRFLLTVFRVRSVGAPVWRPTIVQRSLSQLPVEIVKRL